MASDIFFSLALSILVVHSCVCVQTDFPIQTERPLCNRTFTTLRELQAASNEIDRNVTLWQYSDSDYVLCVNLQPESTEYIGYSSAVFDSISHVVITGTVDSSVVKCETPFNGGLPMNDYVNFPLIITNSSLVVIDGVQFEDCMRPLQFNQVTRIELVSCNFRYLSVPCFFFVFFWGGGRGSLL